MIEKIGRGTVLMIEDCEIKGYPKPKWESKLGATILTFLDVTVTAKTDDAVNDAVNDEITMVVKLRLKEMVHFIAKNKGTKVIDLIGHFNISQRTIKENLKALIEAKLIMYSGSKKIGFYKLTKKLPDKLHV